MTFTPSKHWGARTLRDSHRGYGGFVFDIRAGRIYHAGDSAYFDGFKLIGQKLSPEIALLPIGAYFPESFRRVHMGPDEAVKAFEDLAQNILCRCIMARSSCRSRIWTSRRAGSDRSPGNKT